MLEENSVTTPPNHPLQPSAGGRCGGDSLGTFARRGAAAA